MRVKNKPIEFILEPTQSRNDYNRLKKEWDRKLADSGFFDIEFTNSDGETSPFFRDYPLLQLQKNYTQDAEEYWRRAGLFYHHFDFKNLSKQIYWRMARFIWRHWSEGRTMEEIVAEFHKPNTPRIRFTYSRAKGPPSIYYVHTQLHRVLFPAFFAWCDKEINGVLKLEWDRNSK